MHGGTQSYHTAVSPRSGGDTLAVRDRLCLNQLFNAAAAGPELKLPDAGHSSGMFAGPVASAEAVARYREQGWASFEGLIGAAQAAELSGLILRHAAEHLDRTVAAVAADHSVSAAAARRTIGRAVGGDAAAIALVNASAASAASARDGSTGLSALSNGGLSFGADDFDVDPHNEEHLIPRKVNACYVQDQRYRDLVDAPELRAMAEALVGKPCQVYGDQVFVKGAGIGSEKPFHQDNFYFQFAESADVITCWVALDDALEENGCMRMASGSHRRGTVEHDQHPLRKTHLIGHMTPEDEANVAPAPVRRGGVVCWQGAMLHGSEGNLSDLGRCAYGVHFTAVGAPMLPGAPEPDFGIYESNRQPKL